VQVSVAGSQTAVAEGIWEGPPGRSLPVPGAPGEASVGRTHSLQAVGPGPPTWEEPVAVDTPDRGQGYYCIIVS